MEVVGCKQHWATARTIRGSDRHEYADAMSMQTNSLQSICNPQQVRQLTVGVVVAEYWAAPSIPATIVDLESREPHMNLT